MTPNGNIYLDLKKNITDYGDVAIAPHIRGFFIHEMTHVWQKQNNVLNPITSAIANYLRHVFFYKESYIYTREK